MSVNRLPKLLENTMHNILDSSIVTSWNIRGDISQCQVTIRFKMADMGDMDTLPID